MIQKMARWHAGAWYDSNTDELQSGCHRHRLILAAKMEEKEASQTSI